MKTRMGAAVLAAATLTATAAAAQGPAAPRYASLRGDEANVRRGPGLDHRIDWVFLRPGTPLEITAEHGPWRRVRDADGAGGWVHRAMLRRSRTAVVVAEVARLRADPVAGGRLIARAETGVVGRLDECLLDWCLFEAGGYEGWVAKAEIWGVGGAETFD